MTIKLPGVTEQVSDEFFQGTKIMREDKTDGAHKLIPVATFDRIDEQGNIIFKF